MLWVKRLTSVLLIALITLVLLELALQLLAWGLRVTGRAPATEWHQADVRVLTLGDSNTYGLYYPEAKSYPSRLEARWRADASRPDLRVVNLAYPGTNSFRVRAHIDRFLEKLEPDWVLLLIGNNDFWTPAESPETRPGKTVTLMDRLHQLRVYRLFFMFRQMAEGPVVEIPRPRVTIDESLLEDEEWLQDFVQKLRKSADEQVRKPTEEKVIAPEDNPNVMYVNGERFDMMIHTDTPSVRWRRLPGNIGAIARRVRAKGKQLVLLTYPSHNNFYPIASKKIRQAAERYDIPLIDLERTFKRLCRGDRACPEYFLPDAHPNAEGYAVMAQRVDEALQAMLADGRLVLPESNGAR